MKALVAILSEDLDYLLESSGSPVDKAKGMVNLDAIKKSTRDAVQDALYYVAGLFIDGKRKVFVKDDQGRFDPKNMRYYNDLAKAVKETIENSLGEAEAMASELYYQTDGTQGTDLPAIQKDQKKFSKARFRVQAVTSPRTGSKGFRITY